MARRILLVMISTALLLLTACGGTATQALQPQQQSEQPVASTPQAAKRFQFKVNATSPEADIQSMTLKYFGDRVTALSDGRIEFQYFWAGSLVPITGTLKGVQDGLADISTQALSYASGEVPDFAILEVPFAWPVDAENMKAFHSEVDPIIDELMQEHDQKLLMSNPALMADPISCRGGFLASASDYAGKLFRTAGRWQGETIQAWGGKPVVIPLGDLQSALQRGTVDCTLLIYNLLDSFKIYEAAPYITRVDHSIQHTAFTMNLDKWNELSAADQDIFRQAAVEAWDYGIKLRDDRTLETLANLERNGARLCTPPESELVRLRSAAEQVWEQIRRETGPRGQQIMDIAAKYRDAVTTVPSSGPSNPCS